MADPLRPYAGENGADRVKRRRAALIEAVPHSGPGIILDLTETTYLDSSGVRLLFDMAERLQARRQRMVLVVTQQALVRRVLVLTKLDDAVPLHETVDDALAALSPGF